jgi:hypothetical protein
MPNIKKGSSASSPKAKNAPVATKVVPSANKPGAKSTPVVETKKPVAGSKSAPVAETKKAPVEKREALLSYESFTDPRKKLTFVAKGLCTELGVALGAHDPIIIPEKGSSALPSFSQHIKLLPREKVTDVVKLVQSFVEELTKGKSKFKVEGKPSHDYNNYVYITVNLLDKTVEKPEKKEEVAPAKIAKPAAKATPATPAAKAAPTAPGKPRPKNAPTPAPAAKAKPAPTPTPKKR